MEQAEKDPDNESVMLELNAEIRKVELCLELADLESIKLNKDQTHPDEVTKKMNALLLIISSLLVLLAVGNGVFYLLTN